MAMFTIRAIPPPLPVPDITLRLGDTVKERYNLKTPDPAGGDCLPVQLYNATVVCFIDWCGLGYSETQVATVINPGQGRVEFTIKASRSGEAHVTFRVTIADETKTYPASPILLAVN
jgi:hypothetical protein